MNSSTLCSSQCSVPLRSWTLRAGEISSCHGCVLQVDLADSGEEDKNNSLWYDRSTSSKKFLTFILPMTAFAISIWVSNGVPESPRSVKAGEWPALSVLVMAAMASSFCPETRCVCVAVCRSLPESGLLMCLVARELEDTTRCLKAVGAWQQHACSLGFVVQQTRLTFSHLSCFTCPVLT